MTSEIQQIRNLIKTANVKGLKAAMGICKEKIEDCKRQLAEIEDLANDSTVRRHYFRVTNKIKNDAANWQKLLDDIMKEYCKR